MKISRSTGYALLAVGYIAKHSDQKFISSQSIAKEYDIPLGYLLNILKQLVWANVLRSRRGLRGGFSLAKPTKKITMLQIIEAVEGPMDRQLGLVEQAGGGKFSTRTERAYGKAIAAAKNVFSKTNLLDLGIGNR